MSWSKIDFLSRHYAKCIVNRQFKLCKPGDCHHCDNNYFYKMSQCTEAETFDIMNRADYAAESLRREVEKKIREKNGIVHALIAIAIAAALIYLIVKW